MAEAATPRIAAAASPRRRRRPASAPGEASGSPSRTSRTTLACLDRARVREPRQGVAQAGAHEVGEVGSVSCHGRLAADETEVRQERVAVAIDEHVPSGDGAVRDALPMRRVECRRDVGQQLQPARRVELARLAQLGQARSSHQLHGHESALLPRAGRVQADHARMLGPRQRYGRPSSPRPAEAA